MTDDPRTCLAETFLARAGWGAARRSVLAGDASHRRYDRLTLGPSGQRAVLMDAPPEKGEDVRPFTRIARHLRALGLSAPEILAEDAAHGFLLLEDLGDAVFARVMAKDPAQERPLYAAAVDLLAELHRAPPPDDLPPYAADEMADLGVLPFDWYLDAPDPGGRAALRAGLHEALGRLDTGPRVLVQRDYHAENLIWLPRREGIARVGLLDFQDARAGHPAYDLVSLLRDARRDVSPGLRAGMVARYLDATGLDPAPFHAAAAVLSAQRNLRILGVFARLCLRDGKPHYVDLLPRVWSHLQEDLCHPALSDLRALVAAHLPAPDAPIRERIKARCAQRPMP